MAKKSGKPTPPKRSSKEKSLRQKQQVAEPVSETAGIVQPCDTAFTTTARFIQEYKGDEPDLLDLLKARRGALGLCKKLAEIECALTDTCKEAKFIKIVNVELEKAEKNEVIIKMTVEWKCVAKPM